MSDVYKTDLSFSVSATGDLETLSGIENLKESVFRRIVTNPGTLVHRPNYGVGIKNFQNAPMSLAKKRELASLIQEQCEQDERVVKVLGVGFSEDPSNTFLTEIKVRIEAIGLGEQAFAFSVGDLP